MSAGFHTVRGTIRYIRIGPVGHIGELIGIIYEPSEQSKSPDQVDLFGW